MIYFYIVSNYDCLNNTIYDGKIQQNNHMNRKLIEKLTLMMMFVLRSHSTTP